MKEAVGEHLEQGSRGPCSQILLNVWLPGGSPAHCGALVVCNITGNIEGLWAQVMDIEEHWSSAISRTKLLLLAAPPTPTSLLT